MKILLLLIIIFLLIFFQVSAEPVEIQFAKSKYASGETLQANILAEDIENEIYLYDLSFFNEELTKISITPFLNKIRQNYYVYFQIPIGLEDGNYSLFVNNVVYYKNNSLAQENFNSSFQIIQKEKILTIDPGIILANNLDDQNSFAVLLINNGNDSINASFSSDSELIDLSSSSAMIIDDMTIYAYVSEILKDNYESEFRHLFIKYDNETYEIPVWLGKNEVLNKSIKDEDKSSAFFLADNKLLNLSFQSSESKYLSVQFQNKGKSKIENLKFYLQGNISSISSLEYSDLDSLSSGEIAKQNLFINKNKDAMGHYTGYLVMDSGNDIDKIGLSFYFYDKLNQSSFDNKPLGKDINLGNLEDYDTDVREKNEKIYWILAGVLIFLVLLFLFIKYIKYKKTKVNFPLFRSFLFFLVAGV